MDEGLVDIKMMFINKQPGFENKKISTTFS